MTQTSILGIEDGRLSPWQHPKDSIRTFWQSQFDDVIADSCSPRHKTTFPEIDSVAAANVSLVRKKADDVFLEEDEDEASEQTTSKCSFGQGKGACDKLKSFSCSSRQCYCSVIDEGESGTMCSWGGGASKVRTLNSGASVSKRKPYTFQRIGADYKYQPFEFRHSSNIRDYMALYRKRHTVADVGREVRPPPNFGVDAPDPYAIRIKNICSIVNSCDFTALLPGENDHSCSDFNSVISTTSDSSVKEKEKDKVSNGDKSKRKKGEKPPLMNTRSVPSLTPVRQKQAGNQTEGQGHTRPADDTRSLRDYVEEYEQLRREREALQKSNSLPILLRADASSSPPRSNSGSSVAQRLLDELDSPFKRLLQCKYSKGVEFLRDTNHKKSTSVKLSEFLSKALLGDERLRTGPKNSNAIKSEAKVKVIRKETQKEDRFTHLPELVGQTCEQKTNSRKGKLKNESAACGRVLSLSLEEMEASKHSSSRNSSNSTADDKLPMDYKAKKRKMHKIVDLMSIAR